LNIHDAKRFFAPFPFIGTKTWEVLTKAILRNLRFKVNFIRIQIRMRKDERFATRNTRNSEEFME
jgi:hypothetical protein